MNDWKGCLCVCVCVCVCVSILIDQTCFHLFKKYMHKYQLNKTTNQQYILKLLTLYPHENGHWSSCIPKKIMTLLNSFVMSDLININPTPFSALKYCGWASEIWHHLGWKKAQQNHGMLTTCLNLNWGFRWPIHSPPCLWPHLPRWGSPIRRLKRAAPVGHQHGNGTMGKWWGLRCVRGGLLRWVKHET